MAKRKPKVEEIIPQEQSNDKTETPIEMVKDIDKKSTKKYTYKRKLRRL